ncbi:hypothetical protein [Megasphaera lornae]|nr:hypothetical protein [Megasphaera lornae]
MINVVFVHREERESVFASSKKKKAVSGDTYVPHIVLSGGESAVDVLGYK